MATGTVRATSPPRRLQPAGIADGTIEALKWLAAVLMVGDHVNRFLLDGSVTILFDAGRIVMPLFGILLALNLSRPSAVSGNGADRTVGRTLAMGLVATVPYMLLGAPIAGPLPLNILFTLSLSALVIQALLLQTRAGLGMAIALFVVGGFFVEFWWPGVAIVVGAWLWRMGRPVPGGALFGLGMLGLCAINGNGWALAAIPLLLVASQIELRLRRHRAFFYAFYPLHLAVINVLVLWRT